MSPKLSRRSTSSGTPEKSENQTENGFEADGAPERTATQFVPIGRLSLPESQPRRYFDQAGMQQLSASVKEHGILQPIIVRPVGEKYVVVAGERRYRAALEAGLTEVPALVREMSDEQAVQYALVENLQREDLTPVEETEGMLQLLAINLKCGAEQVPSLLYRMQKEAKGKTAAHNVMGYPEAEIVRAVFDSIGRMSWDSFATNRLPLLNLPADILEALRSGQIEYTKAKEIARLESEPERMALLEEAIAGSLSLSQIRERVKAKKPPVERDSLETRLDATYKQIKASMRKNQAFWENPQTQERFQALLTELETFLSTPSQD